MAQNQKIRVAVLFGGQSPEHEISLRSVHAVLAHLDQNLFEVVPMAIDRNGGWYEGTSALLFLEGQEPENSGSPPFLPQGINVVFPVLHGPGGEDGTVQGFLELCGVPCVGASTLGSALAMDKILAKRVLRDAGIPVLPWAEVHRSDFSRDSQGELRRVLEEQGLPCFVKPSSQGSSVGISKVTNREELESACERAFAFDEWILLEPAVEVRELEIAVLEEGGALTTTSPGEVSAKGWYDFEEKYQNQDAQLLVPAPDVEEDLFEALQEYARKAFRTLRLSGMARVDFFLDTYSGEVSLNEVNTLPGFTSISMFPKLFEHSGVSFEELLTRLIQSAVSEDNKSA
ncbi:MAG: D-alanine--D-alanine ligase [Planctomycetes bacterium]|nr:D-alanine--D-alanine ligase [Planctomycetota bacterium]